MQKTKLALFPLQIFLLPGEKTNLHIFEDRYRQLLEDCENTKISFGIPYAENGYLDTIGCVVKVTKVLKQYPNGSSDIEIEATEVFKINQFYKQLSNKLYPGGDVTILEEEELEPISAELMSEVSNYLAQAQIDLEKEILPLDLSVFQIASLLELNQTEKIKLVKANPMRRERILLNHLALFSKLMEQQESVQGNIFLN